MKITPNELYNRTPVYVDRDVRPLNGCYYSHIPEIMLEDIPEPNTRIERRILWHYDEDHRRYWELATVWFDDHPVMIVQNAGREGDDHAQRFITDPVAYIEMVSYLQTIVPLENSHDVVHPDVPRDDLMGFYGRTAP